VRILIHLIDVLINYIYEYVLFLCFGLVTFCAIIIACLGCFVFTEKCLHVRTCTCLLTVAEQALPHALDNFDHVVEPVRNGSKQMILFLDYDGTLSPIVARPELAVLSQDTRDVIKKIAQKYTTAIVSGRAKDDVKKLVGLTELFYAGSHGFDIEGPDRPIHNGEDKKNMNYQVGTEFIPILTAFFERLADSLKNIQGSLVENNIFALAAHYRLVKNEADVQKIFENVKSIADQEEFKDKVRLTFGKKVIEVRANYDWHKGKAVIHLLKCMDLLDPNRVFAIYIGDDKTDEDAFRALKEENIGIGILVAKDQDSRVINRQTQAQFTLKDTEQVAEFLKNLSNQL
jgi:trehalose 6-phosphate phosphatase